MKRIVNQGLYPSQWVGGRGWKNAITGAWLGRG